MTMIESLNELHAVERWAVDNTESWVVVVRNRWGTVSLIASDEDGDLFFQRVPTDDAEDVPHGYVDKVPGVDTGWPLELIWPVGTRDDWAVYERVDAPFTAADDENRSQ